MLIKIRVASTRWSYLASQRTPRFTKACFYQNVEPIGSKGLEGLSKSMTKFD